jgi:hypothetical protein
MQLKEAINESWKNIAPFWPLKNLIAVNPLQGLEDMAIEDALIQGAALFQQESLPQPMESVNRESIKWFQAFFDDGQATIRMPGRDRGLYTAWLNLARFDDRLCGDDEKKARWITSLPDTPEKAIGECFLFLGIPADEQTTFLTLMLTTLPGWAAHVKYRTEWSGGESRHAYPVTQAEYLAVRLAITCLLWPEARDLLSWHHKAVEQADRTASPINRITRAEEEFRLPLLHELEKQKPVPVEKADAQMVFCIDVRSEPFRRALESVGNYDTLGFAGFFGVPTRIEDEVTGESYASCPVLLEPKHTVRQKHGCTESACSHSRAGYERLTSFKRFYQSLKYTFSTPFALVETMGIANGVWMGIRSFTPALAEKITQSVRNAIRRPEPVVSSMEDISLEDQCVYGEGALRLMGLTSNFAPLVVLCGHGSVTRNNAYASALDCGACGGRHGGANARVLAAILNNPAVRTYLETRDISIPEKTVFVPAEHNTTTDAVELFTEGLPGFTASAVADLRKDLEKARSINSHWRAGQLGESLQPDNSAAHTATRSIDWAQVRPEWGLARNGAFIIGKRDLTRKMKLDGRCFLHSYDWTQDPEGTALTTILTAPMVVAQWINSQYLFSTLDNVAFGGGSKITKNITGKLGIMQGNASDLMHGLPLQSVWSSDQQPYHEPIRLMTVVHAPRSIIDPIIRSQQVLQKLFGNGWVTLACIDPTDQNTWLLNRDFQWDRFHSPEEKDNMVARSV